MIRNLTTVIVAGLCWGTLINSTRAAAAPRPETLLIIEPSKENPRNSEGDTVVLRDGSLLLAYTRFTGGARDDSAASICARVTADGGKTWSGDRVLVANEGQANVMSVSIIRLADGELLLFYMRKDGWGDCNMFVRRSIDEFATLSNPIRVTTRDGYHVVNNDRVVLLNDGRLVVPTAVHPCPDGTRKTWSAEGIPLTYLSDNGGRTWRPDETKLVRPDTGKVYHQEPGVVELRDQRLWMFTRTNGGVQFEAFSSDRGSSWTGHTPTRIASPLSPATIERVPWTGDLLLVFNDHSGLHPFTRGRRTPLCIALSTDDGKTWSKSRVIEPDPDGWYCYTSVTFLEDRAILAYCAGDKKVGGLNRLKVLALPRGWLYPD